MNSNYYCVIMAGGVGARFWPMSRASHPKQFIDILGVGETLIQQTFRRFAAFCPKENIFVVTNAHYKDLVKTQLSEIKEENILCEPSRRNTAPCIVYASYKIQAANPDAIVAVTPADHVVLKEEAFTTTLTQAMHVAQQNDWLITLGITPTHPNTGYGYIQYDENEVCAQNNKIKKVKIFTEKPPLEMAKSFLSSGDFLWNAGIFVWSLKSSMKAFKSFLPEIDEIFSQGASLLNTQEEASFINRIYPNCKNISIDYGLMEKAKNVYVSVADLGWSDLGTWGSLYEVRNKDEEGNAKIGENVMLFDTKDCVITMPKDKLVVIQGLEDYIVVEDHNTLLICKKEDEQKLRDIVETVGFKKGTQYV